MLKMRLERPRMIGVFCLLFILTNCINKYVLSVLKFTFPTIFQGWQTLVGALVLHLLMLSGKLDFSLKTLNREDVALWLPSMFFFVGTIYAGSRALASLPVPVFFAFQNLASVISLTVDVILKSKVNVWSYIFNMALVVSSIGVAKTDPQNNTDGYFWVCYHVLSLGAYSTYQKLIKGRLKLRPAGRLYCNYVYSMILFAPASYFLGEALEASKFPHLYFAKFYICCGLSGILGVFLSLVVIQLEPLLESSGISLDFLSSAAKIITSVLSLVIFPFTLTVPYVSWLAINLLASLFSEELLPLAHPSNSNVVENT
ncbi:UDP-N-acetylglucosamine transporter TMEM241 homolog isoform X2 [Liolophura sinensis]|uniref:UDP-N-acetylglucosamine transporter TMEM241 homolog isoform X2 n=1 Tax=Liolophura sinensis TaxID=3198878 RepID=UPI0031582A54